jgi:hypothetical protein
MIFIEYYFFGKLKIHNNPKNNIAEIFGIN